MTLVIRGARGMGQRRTRSVTQSSRWESVSPVDAAPAEGGEPRAAATLLATIDEPVALGPAPDGALYITCLPAEGQGALLRVDTSVP